MILKRFDRAIDSVKKTALCQNGGEAGVKYVGSGRIVLAPEGSFRTNSSQECCGLCDAIKGTFSPFYSRLYAKKFPLLRFIPLTLVSCYTCIEHSPQSGTLETDYCGVCTPVAGRLAYENAYHFAVH